MKKYGRLTIIKEVEPHIQPSGQKKHKVLVRCDCGNFTEVLLNNLKKGTTKSCGCLKKEGNNYKHGLAKHLLYKIWDNMKQRCYNSKGKRYKDWGGRGIVICAEWINNSETFIKWALINGYKKGLLIDRIDNDGNYKPDNIRFVDAGLSNRNTRLLRSHNTSGYCGVCWDKQRKKWVAHISIDGKMKHLGRFDNSRLAALRYDAEAFLLNDGRPLNFDD